MSISSINYLKKFKNPNKSIRGIRLNEMSLISIKSNEIPKKIDYNKFQSLEKKIKLPPESVNIKKNFFSEIDPIDDEFKT